MLATFAATAPVVATFHAHLDRSRLMEAVGPALRTVSRRIAAPVAVSEAAARFVGRVMRGPVEIVPNGVDVGRFAEPGAPADGLPGERRILWVNRLDPQKGFPTAVRAFGALAAELEDVALVVAGDGADRDAVRLLDEAVRDRVAMLGNVPHDRLPAYHAAAELFVAAATGQESFGIVLVEAMAAGLPVVATDIAGYREVVRDGVDGLLVPPNDPEALAAAFRRVLADAELAARLASSGRERARGYDWDVVAPRLEAIYRRVARR
jgi:phosphatidylinositol alpha-mannosyltransferase